MPLVSHIIVRNSTCCLFPCLWTAWACCIKQLLSSLVEFAPESSLIFLAVCTNKYQQQKRNNCQRVAAQWHLSRCSHPCSTGGSQTVEQTVEQRHGLTVASGITTKACTYRQCIQRGLLRLTAFSAEQSQPLDPYNSWLISQTQQQTLT
jgi:hypothetical protein